MQTILGGGGTIGKLLAVELRAYTSKIRIVSRNPERVHRNDEVYSCNLLNAEEVKRAVSGSEVVYLTVGLPYKKSVWRKNWPVVMRNTIDACRVANAKLVFFDNVYMYNPDELGNMDEQTTIAPISEKGKVRAAIAGALMEYVQRGEVEALIARSADFYGPEVGANGMLRQLVLENLSKCKKANWLGSDSCKHSFTYTPDAAKATAILGNTPSAYGKVWHLPTHKNPPTGKEWIEMAAEILNAKPDYRTVGTMSLRILGIFIPVMRELIEMYYQYDRDYVFNSDKFCSEFDYKPMPYAEGLRATLTK